MRDGYDPSNSGIRQRDGRTVGLLEFTWATVVNHVKRQGYGTQASCNARRKAQAISSVAFGYDRDKLMTCAAPTTCSPPGAAHLRIIRDQSAGLPTSVTLDQVSETLAFDTFDALLSKNASSTAGSL